MAAIAFSASSPIMAYTARAADAFRPPRSPSRFRAKVPLALDMASGMVSMGPSCRRGAAARLTTRFGHDSQGETNGSTRGDAAAAARGAKGSGLALLIECWRASSRATPACRSARGTPLASATGRMAR